MFSYQKNNPYFLAGYLFKFALLITLPILCQIYPFTSQAATIDNGNYYEVVSPEAFENITITPSHFAMGDLNGNGYDDFVFVEEGQAPEIIFFHPDSLKTGFYDPEDVHISFTPDTYGSIDIIDATGDGTNELLFYPRQWTGPQAIYNWTGEQFEEISFPGGVTSVSFRGNVHSAYGDFSGDGTLDLHQGVQQARNTRNFFTYNIFNQDGSGHEQLSSDYHPSIFSFRTGSSYAFDFNNDGSLELYSNTRGYNDEFYTVTNGNFSTVGGHMLTEVSHSYGSAIGDYTNNGYPDIYRANYGSRDNILFRNHGGLEFEKITNLLVNLTSLDSRNAMWGDITNNGWLDLAVAESGASVSLFENEEAESFNILSDEPVMARTGQWRHAVFIDYNQNGRLDLLTIGEHSDRVRLYRNIAPQQNWLGFTLEQDNTYYTEPIGARLVLEAEINGDPITQTRIYNPFVGRYAQVSGRQHFGLAGASSAELTIHWPSGQQTTHSFNEEELNNYHEITEPPAGNLIATEGRPFISAGLDSTETDTLRVRNIGNSEVTLEEGELFRDYLEVTSYQTGIAPQQTGWIEVAFSPTSFDHLGIHTDTVAIHSDAVNSPIELPIDLEGQTQPAEFERSTDEMALTHDNDGSTASVWGDFTGNDLPDVVLLKRDAPNELYHQTVPGEFEFIEEDVISHEGRFSAAGAVGDYNRNGHPDLILANEDRENYLYRNNGEGRFERVMAEGIANRDRATSAIRFTDLTDNGFLDIITGNKDTRRDEILIYRDEETYERINAGDFTEATTNTSSLGIADLNNDGSPELITTEHRENQPAFIRVYSREDDLIYNQVPIEGLTDINYHSDGVLPADLNGNGYLDLVFINHRTDSEIAVFHNQGDFQFERVFRSIFDNLEASPSDITVFDHNLNGYPDLFMSERQSLSSNLLFESINGESFLQITAGEMVTSADRRASGVVAVDYNRNNRKELFISNRLAPNDIYRNTTITEEDEWIGIIPEALAEGANNLIPGTRVTVSAEDESDELPKQTQLLGAQSARSYAITPLQFAAGESERYKVDIVYPGGTEYSTVVSGKQTYHTIEADVTSAPDEHDDLPDEVALHSNYPNPFNPKTDLPFELPSSGHATLKIYDIQGRLVSELIDERLDAGRHTVNFDASDLPSGMYIAVLNISGERHIEKMTLIK